MQKERKKILKRVLRKGKDKKQQKFTWFFEVRMEGSFANNFKKINSLWDEGDLLTNA